MADDKAPAKTVKIKLKDGTTGDYTPAGGGKSTLDKVVDMLHSTYKGISDAVSGGDDDPIVKKLNDDVNETRKKVMAQKLKESGDE